MAEFVVNGRPPACRDTAASARRDVVATRTMAPQGSVRCAAVIGPARPPHAALGSAAVQFAQEIPETREISGGGWCKPRLALSCVSSSPCPLRCRSHDGRRRAPPPSDRGRQRPWLRIAPRRRNSQLPAPRASLPRQHVAHAHGMPATAARRRHPARIERVGNLPQRRGAGTNGSTSGPSSATTNGTRCITVCPRRRQFSSKAANRHGLTRCSNRRGSAPRHNAPDRHAADAGRPPRPARNCSSCQALSGR
jgi:hypothetical protein